MIKKKINYLYIFLNTFSKNINFLLSLSNFIFQFIYDFLFYKSYYQILIK